MKPALTFLFLLTVYHTLFWQEALGVNLTLFGWSILVYDLFTCKAKRSFTRYFLLTLSVISGVGVVLVNSVFSNIMFFFIVMASHANLRASFSSAFESLGNGMVNAFNLKQGLVPGLNIARKTPRSKAVLYLRIVTVPVLVVFLYILLFSAGNSVFNELSGGLLKRVGEIFNDLSFHHVAFIGLGVVIVRWIMRQQWAKPFRINGENSLKRKVNPQKPFKNMALKHEYLTAFILLVLLNGLFLVVNFIDVKWVWFQFYIPANFSLKAFVHEGAGWLIVTLLISITLILYYFRGNLTYYPNNARLKYLAYLWIFQNIILAVSVVIRTSYYVHFHGLASKRLGMFIFLTMVFFGLITLIVKIFKNLNTSFIIRYNSAFIAGTLIIASVIPWSRIIVQYNLQHFYSNQIDVDNYLRLDPRIYPMLYTNLPAIEKQIKAHQKNEVKWIRYSKMSEFKKDLDRKTEHYLKRRQDVSVYSWTLADQTAVKLLQSRKL